MEVHFPFKGRIAAENFTIKSVDIVLKLFPGLPSGDFKYVIDLYYGLNGRKIFELNFTVYCKMDTLNPIWL
jgi:hypothetical protein